MSPSDIPADAAFEIKLIFLKELASGHQKARGAMDQLLKSPTEAALKEVQGFFHKIAGTAHAADFPVLGHLAAVCEDFAKMMVAGAVAKPEKGVALLCEGMAGV